MITLPSWLTQPMLSALVAVVTLVLINFYESKLRTGKCYAILMSISLFLGATFLPAPWSHFSQFFVCTVSLLLSLYLRRRALILVSLILLVGAVTLVLTSETVRCYIGDCKDLPVQSSTNKRE